LVPEHGEGHQVARPQANRCQHRFRPQPEAAGEVIDQRTYVTRRLVEDR
jgi:hypothetical protein